MSSSIDAEGRVHIGRSMDSWDRQELRKRYAVPILDSMANALGHLDHRSHGAKSQIARALKVHPRQVGDALEGRVSVETLIHWAELLDVDVSSSDRGASVEAWSARAPWRPKNPPGGLRNRARPAVDDTD